MIFPWPEHIKFAHALVFAFALMMAELLLGTGTIYCFCVFLYVMFTAMAFNFAGGLYTASGSYIAFQSLQSLLISQVAKVFFLQPADSNLHQPVTSIAIYTVGEFALMMAALLTHRYRRKKPLLDSREDAKFTMAMSMTASAVGITAAFLSGTIGADVNGAVAQGSIWSYIGQLGNFLLIGILLGTAHIIRASGGKRSARWWTIIPIIVFLFLGIAGNSKQGIYEPLALWVFCCALYRYRFNRMQVLGLIASGFIAVFIVFPVVQYSRAYVREGSLVNRTKLVYNFMRDHSITDIRASYTADEELKEEGGHSGYYFYYGKDEQLLDRVSLISVDDAVVNYTMSSGTHGYDAFDQEFIAMVPRVFLPDKDKYLKAPVVNVMGRETGILAPTDEGTYIAFSLFGPSFYMGGWWAVSVLTFVVIGITFLLLDSFYGDARQSLYALIPIGNNLHGAAEMILPVAFGALLHLCLIGAFTLWMLRKLSIFAQIFIQRYSWFEKSPTSLAVPRPMPVWRPMPIDVRDPLGPAPAEGIL